MAALGWAIGLSVLSAISYAAAAVAQERLARAAHRGRVLWAVSLAFTVVGAGLHVVALAFGTVGVVQALGTLTLLFALPIAAWRTGTPNGAAAWRNAGLTVAGLVALVGLTVAPAGPAGPAALSRDEARHLALGAVLAVCVLVCAARHAHGPRWRGLLLAGAAGVAFAMASVFSKAVLASFAVGGAALVGMFAVAGYLLSQLSYRGAGLAGPLAMVSVANPLIAAVIGVVVLDEGFRFGATGSTLACLAGVLAAVGVVGLSARVAAPARRDFVPA